LSGNVSLYFKNNANLKEYIFATLFLKLQENNLKVSVPAYTDNGIKVEELVLTNLEGFINENT
jgi:hypothetical protein